MTVRTYPFHFCDPVASFSNGSPGFIANRISGSWGDRLGIDAWKLGRMAYSRLRSQAGGEVSVDEMLNFMGRAEPYLNDFLEAMEARVIAGTLTLINSKDEPPSTGGACDRLALQERLSEWHQTRLFD